MSKILIVEDEEAIADLEKDYLELSGFKVEVANDGETGLKKALGQEFDMFILDLCFPGLMDSRSAGRSGIKRIRPLSWCLPEKDDIDKIRGLGLGADDYMTKPFSPSGLVARVKAHLARYDRLTGSAVEANKVIEIRGLKIDTTARRVWVNEEERTFTTKEFDLLTFLASHPNHVYTKEELFREIWDMESIGDIATVTVHIKKIRRRLRWIPPTLSILRRYGELDTGSRYRTEHIIFGYSDRLYMEGTGRFGLCLLQCCSCCLFPGRQETG